MNDARIEKYAEVLLSAATAEGALDTVTDELHEVARVVESSDELRTSLADTYVPVARRQGIVESLIGERSHPVTTNLVNFVVGAGRGSEIPRIVHRLVELAAEEQNRVVAIVRSAQPLTDDQKSRLTAALTERLGYGVDVRVVIDPSVLGGIVTEIGDTVIDGSVRTRLSRLKERL